jgi:hypothetical protein
MKGVTMQIVQLKEALDTVAGVLTPGQFQSVEQWVVQGLECHHDKIANSNLEADIKVLGIKPVTDDMIDQSLYMDMIDSEPPF